VAWGEGAGEPDEMRGVWRGTQDCVHCGLCLTQCPTYLTTGVEMSSPRGRIWMLRALEEGEAALSSTTVRHLDQCVGCLACAEACPSQVPYAGLLEAARETIERSFPRPATDRWLRWLLVNLFPYPRRLAPALAVLRWYQRLGLSAWLRRSRLLPRLAPRLAGMEALLPDIPAPRERRPLPRVSRSCSPRRGTLGLLTGCAQRYLMPELNQATVRVLTRAGYDVVAPPEQGCCGALHVHQGRLGEARQCAREIIATFEATGADLVVANAAGCGAAMKDYGRLLRDDASWRDRAQAFVGTVRDVSEVLAGLDWNGALQPLDLAVTYHDACHLAHAQRLRREPREILARIPGLRLVPLAEADVCCGSGGVYNVLEPGPAGRILDRKIARVRETGASVVAAGNLGCLLQLRAGLRQAGLPVKAVHPVQILDWSMNGERF